MIIFLVSKYQCQVVWAFAISSLGRLQPSMRNVTYYDVWYVICAIYDRECKIIREECYINL